MAAVRRYATTALHDNLPCGARAWSWRPSAIRDMPAETRTGDTRAGDGKPADGKLDRYFFLSIDHKTSRAAGASACACNVVLAGMHWVNPCMHKSTTPPAAPPSARNRDLGID